jgi:TatD DNase family protein
VLNALQTYPRAKTSILHWFSGSQRELARAIELSRWFSVSLTMLGWSKGRALTANMPRDRVLTETDGPFARVGRQAALPWDAESLTAALAEL